MRIPIDSAYFRINPNGCEGGTAYGLGGMKPQAAPFRLWWNGAAVRIRQEESGRP